MMNNINSIQFKIADGVLLMTPPITPPMTPPRSPVEEYEEEADAGVENGGPAVANAVSGGSEVTNGTGEGAAAAAMLSKERLELGKLMKHFQSYTVIDDKCREEVMQLLEMHEGRILSDKDLECDEDGNTFADVAKVILEYLREDKVNFMGSKIFTGIMESAKKDTGEQSASNGNMIERVGNGNKTGADQGSVVYDTSAAAVAANTDGNEMGKENVTE